MRYLFDTDILSNLLRPSPSLALIRRLAATPPEEQSTSSITVGELYYGASRLGDRGDSLMARIDAALLNNLPILPFDASAARVYGALRAQLEARGTPIGDADVRIAAIALVNDLTMVTANLRHFERVPELRIENWLV